MTAIFLLGGSGLAVFGLVLLVRAWEADTWARSLVRYQLGLPRELAAKDVAAWLSQLSAHTVPPRFSLLPWWPVALEVEATASGITHTVLVPKSREVAILASLRASLPGVRVELVPDQPKRQYHAGVELRLTSQTAPLADDRAATAANAALAAMQPLPRGASIKLQWLFAGVRARKAAGMDTDAWRWSTGSEPADRDVLRDQRQKQRASLLVAAGRVVASGEKNHAFAAVHRVVGALRVLEAPGVHFLWRTVPSWLVARRTVGRQVPLLAWPMTVNVLEAAGLVALPLGGVSLPGLARSSSRQVPPAPDLPRSGGVVIGETTYPGTAQPLVLKEKDRLMATYVLGPSGTGKSTLLANMALQDIAAGYGCVVLDPKVDLVTEILARFPDHRRDDLWLLDPSDLDAPVGFNPLAAAGGEHERELATETITSVLRDIYRPFWGPRTDDLLRAALLSLVQVPAPNGEPFAMTEIPELFSNAALRRYVAGHPRQHERWRQYWAEYDQRSPAEQINMVGPVANKLRNFTHRTSLRLVLGQAHGLDLSKIFTQAKVLLVPLSEGQIGAESAALVGSLLVGSLWQTALRRTTIPAKQRRSVPIFLDEFQNLVRMSDDVPDMLAMARGMGLGLVLAHQYAKQLPEAVRAAVLGTARTQIFFQTEFEDAQLVAKRLEPTMTADDLRHLGPYEIAARMCVNGQTRTPVTGRTLPLSPATRDAHELRRVLADAHGTARADVEASLLARAQVRSGKRPARLGEVPSQEATA